MKYQISKHNVERIEINTQTSDSMYCGLCKRLDMHHQECMFYDSKLIYDRTNAIIRCYECIRSGKEIE